jgi:hypothetical protein
MDWTAVEFDEVRAKPAERCSMDWTAVEFDEVMGEASAERATAWTGRSSSMSR